MLISFKWCVSGARPGLLSSPALRGTMRDVQSDERASFGFDVNAASVAQLLAWVYPALYPVHDPTGDWGRPGPDGRCRTALRGFWCRG